MTIFTSSFCEDVLDIGARLSMYIISPEYFLTSGFAFPTLNVWPRETFFPPTTIELPLKVSWTIKFSGDPPVIGDVFPPPTKSSFLYEYVESVEKPTGW